MNNVKTIAGMLVAVASLVVGCNGVTTQSLLGCEPIDGEVSYDVTFAPMETTTAFCARGPLQQQEILRFQSGIIVPWDDHVRIHQDINDLACNVSLSVARDQTWASGSTWKLDFDPHYEYAEGTVTAMPGWCEGTYKVYLQRKY